MQTSLQLRLFKCGLSRLACRIVMVALLLFAVLSLFIAAWPARIASPIVKRSDWLVEGQAFQNISPQRFELPDSMRDSSESVYWRTWSPATLGTTANITTAPFKAPQFIAIPYGGFAGIEGFQLNLICLKTGNRFAVATARTNTQMTTSFVRIPHNWCEGDTVLNAQSRSGPHHIEVGTPFKISWIDYYKNTFVGLFGLFLLIFAVSWGSIFIPSLFIAVSKSMPYRIAIGFLFFGIDSYALFFAYYYAYGLAKWLSGAIIACSLLTVWWYYVYRREKLFFALRHWKLPTILWFTVAMGAFALALATPNGAGSWSTNSTFAPVEWSTDNQLPMLISEYIFHGLDPKTISIIPPWKISDRPPLAYGAMASLRLVSWLIASHKDGYALFYQYALIAGIVINGLWIVGLFSLLSTLNMDVRSTSWIALTVGLTPFVIFNSVYIWPKMLGAAFGLVAFVQLLEPSHYLKHRHYKCFGASLLIAAALSGLALLSHGGTAFGIIASILIALRYRGLPRFSLGLQAVLIGTAILTPWVLWQHLVQPPGNALTKYALAGTFGFGEDNKSIFETIQDAYASLSASSWLDLKLHNIQSFIYPPGSRCGTLDDPLFNCTLDQVLRTRDYLFLGPSLRFLVLGFIPLLLGRWMVIERDRQSIPLHFMRLLVATGVLSVGFYALLGFKSDFNHMQSFQSILEILIGLSLALYAANRWYFDLAIRLSICYAIFIWIIDPLFSAPHMDPIAVSALCCLSLAVYRWFALTRPDESSVANS